ncbi:rhodanese-like/PpiC domain-containing protein 12, chloroplastic isoform X3 [Asparagus officinalis]|uniref:rhodanese-like/PpiC domain-containing protein 12, chloroplastic isoform X3 n=1 Tax=Asparagus officinalis TaxID=4686 RepID=UPI00098E5A52|nr:rhodanese-like/PpiC domain-containing protein 12, chloroplastic isoform X3 [Asparagus officinalis]
MLRTSSLSYPVTFFSNLRLPVLSSFRSPFPSFPPKLVSTPISAPQTPPFCQRTPSSMVGSNPRPQGKVMFSSGRSDGGNKEILVQHLLVGQDDVKMLTELQKRISEGVDLSDLAVEYSICPSKENGGMLGWVRKGQMVPEFEEAAFSAPLNKVVRCKTKFGWHLLQVLSEREESKLEDIAPEELHSKMQDPIFIEEAQLIDVREPEEVYLSSVNCQLKAKIIFLMKLNHHFNRTWSLLYVHFYIALFCLYFCLAFLFSLFTLHLYFSKC